MLFGADALLSDWRIGLIAGYSHSEFDVADRASSGDSDNYHLGLYGGTEWGDVAFRSGIAYSWHDLSTSRAVSFSGIDEVLTADYMAGTFQAFGELGYRVDTAAASFEPFANLAYVDVNTDSYAETGGDAALTGGGESTGTAFTTLGLRASSPLRLGTINTTARGAIGWRHAFGDSTPEATQAFEGSDVFTIAGVPIARDSAVVDVGLDMNLNDSAMLGFSYSGQIASAAQDHRLTAELTVNF